MGYWLSLRKPVVWASGMRIYNDYRSDLAKIISKNSQTFSHLQVIKILGKLESSDIQALQGVM